MESIIRILWHRFHALSVTGLLVVCPLFTRAQALDFGAGLAALEEGDDRLRGALLGQLGWGNDYAARLYFASREMGPVSEQTLILSAVKHWPIFKSKYLRAEVGPVLMDERYQINFSKAEDKNFNRSEENYNLGGVFGLNVSVPSSQLLFELSWNSHIFPAGVAGLFLASGRKQTLSMTLGMRL